MPPLRMLVFVVGAGSLGAEIAAVRLMAPYFGASTIVWANTIGVVLVALSVGYWAGGRFADRHPHIRGLCLLALAAACLLAVVPFAGRPLFDVAVNALDELSAGAFLGSLLAVLVLVAVPVLLLGAVTPWALRLAIRGVEDAGTVAGRLYALSTVGSLVGTLLSALVLIPFAGTRRTFLAFALAIAVVAALGLRSERRFALVPLAIAALLLVPVGTVKAADGARVLYETETQYQYARVLERPDGTRALELNEGHATHSLRRPGTVLTGDYWDDHLVLPFAVSSAAPARVAILGNAAGTVARAFGALFPATRVDAVEIDPELSQIGRRFFDMRGPHLRVFHQDARPYLRRTRSRYDVVSVDAYRQPYIPFYLATREFFSLARARLRPGGLLILNVGHPEGHEELERALTATLGDVFSYVARDPVEDTNTLLVASDRPIGGAALAARSPGLPRALRPLAAAVAARLAPALRTRRRAFTDDRAAVEWLVDRSILRYAAGD